jgi:ribosome-interacting GTPase 1
MPANLTPQYRKAESAYRQAESPQVELDCLQRMLREIPKHKGTDRLQGDLKAKIAKLKLALLRPSNTTGAKGLTTKLPKQGAGRVLLLGAPNAGKSQLLATLTHAKPEIAPYPFTTQLPMPGMMSFEDCQFQLIDLPPLAADQIPPATMEFVRGADLALLVVDLASDDLVEETAAIVDRFSASKTRLGRATMLDENDVGVSNTHTLVLLNKIDVDGARERILLLDEYLQLPFDRLEVSALLGTGLAELRRQIFERLEIVRVYSKHPSEKEPDMTSPFIIRRGQSLVEVAEQVHHSLATSFKGARLWTANNQGCIQVKPDYIPSDGDIVELS